MADSAWVKPRKPMSKYPKTPQQRKVAIGGRMIREQCTGLKGSDFSECRSEVLRCAFDEDECPVDLKDLRDQLAEEEGLTPVERESSPEEP